MSGQDDDRLVTLKQASPILGYTVQSLQTLMSRFPDRWPEPVVRAPGKPYQYRLSELLAAAGDDTQQLSGKIPTVSEPSGLIRCLECGQDMRVLGRHLGARHKLTAAEYRQKWGLPRTAALAADQTRSRWATHAHDTIEERREALRPYTDPAYLAELQRRGVEHVRESHQLPLAQEHRAPGRQRAVRAMNAARMERLEQRARDAGYASLQAAINETRSLPLAAAAELIGVSEKTVSRRRREWLQAESS